MIREILGFFAFVFITKMGKTPVCLDAAVDTVEGERLNYKRQW